MAEVNLIEYHRTGDVQKDTEQIIESAQKHAFREVATILVFCNWLIGKRIDEEELQGADRAEYGTTVIKNLSKHLTEKYGRGYSKRNLYEYLQFYRTYPDFVHLGNAQSAGSEKSTEEELRTEIRTQKELFYFQQDEKKEGGAD